MANAPKLTAAQIKAIKESAKGQLPKFLKKVVQTTPPAVGLKAAKAIKKQLSKKEYYTQQTGKNIGLNYTKYGGVVDVMDFGSVNSPSQRQKRISGIVNRKEKKKQDEIVRKKAQQIVDKQKIKFQVNK